uniref:Putative secreted protein n=1 Tax=Panstrongylus lignarius TaxID=156445 RepID=A0A224XTP4_9HEMI
MSALDNLPLSFVMVMVLALPVDFSTAVTFSIPFASTSNVTSICGIPLGAGGKPESSKVPKRLLSFVMARSPSNT